MRVYQHEIVVDSCVCSEETLNCESLRLVIDE